MQLNLRIIDPHEFTQLTPLGKFDIIASIDQLSRLVALNRSGDILLDLRKADQLSMSHMDMVDIVDYMIDHQEVFCGKIAVLISQNQPREPDRFFEKLSLRRGLLLRVFDEYENAIEWLATAKTVI